MVGLKDFEFKKNLLFFVGAFTGASALISFSLAEYNHANSLLWIMPAILIGYGLFSLGWWYIHE